jgi:hypothetical protein
MAMDKELIYRFTPGRNDIIYNNTLGVTIANYLHLTNYECDLLRKAKERNKREEIIIEREFSPNTILISGNLEYIKRQLEKERVYGFYRTKFPLIAGRLYYFKDILHDEIHMGIFIRYDYVKEDEHDREICVFEGFWSENIQMAIPTIFLKVTRHSGPLLCKQMSRGLCDRIPEDCAGIIERMLIGDRVVGKGPDRYPERDIAIKIE